MFAIFYLVVLKTQKLTLCADAPEKSGEPLGCISLDDVDVLVDDEGAKEEDGSSSSNTVDHKHYFQFSLITPYATHLLAAESQKDLDAWIEVCEKWRQTIHMVTVFVCFSFIICIITIIIHFTFTFFIIIIIHITFTSSISLHIPIIIIIIHFITHSHL